MRRGATPVRTDDARARGAAFRIAGRKFGRVQARCCRATVLRRRAPSVAFTRVDREIDFESSDPMRGSTGPPTIPRRSRNGLRTSFDGSWLPGTVDHRAAFGGARLFRWKRG
ncbi:hypothetical protein C2U71_03965 [Burkholderia ubonensis]|nr:hypothetical protein C2U71_03965 [Burkholderia ubonensis]